MSTLVARLQPVTLLPFEYPQDARTIAYQPAASLTVARGTLAGQITAAGATLGQVVPYASGNADGSQVPIGIFADDFSTDASGGIVLGTGTSFGLSLGHLPNVYVYVCGTFKVADLTGLDANAVTKLLARQFLLNDGTLKIRIP